MESEKSRGEAWESGFLTFQVISMQGKLRTSMVKDHPLHLESYSVTDASFGQPFLLLPSRNNHSLLYPNTFAHISARAVNPAYLLNREFLKRQDWILFIFISPVPRNFLEMLNTHARARTHTQINVIKNYLTKTCTILMTRYGPENYNSLKPFNPHNSWKHQGLFWLPLPRWRNQGKIG